MQLPYKYDDLLKDDIDLDTLNTTVRELYKRDIREKEIVASQIGATLDSKVDWKASELFSDEVWNSLLKDSEMFSQTFFDDIGLELDLENTHDSLFAQTLPYHGHWTGPPINKDVLIKKSHDCMWAGHCGSSEHKDDCAMHRLWAGLIIPPKMPAAIVPVQSSQQSLLKPSLRNAGVPVINLITPQTPPMSDDEEKNGNKQDEFARLSDVDGDEELIEYFNSKPDNFGGPQIIDEEEVEVSSSESSETGEEESEEKAGPSTATSNVTSIISNIYATKNDHSYFKEINSSMIMSDLGIDTPSDSEEEIDVVSVPDKKYPVANRMAYIPPTNPPKRGRRCKQTPVKITRRNNNNNNINNNMNITNRNGIKVMLPTKRAPPAINYPPAKRRATAAVNDNKNKGKRTRQTRPNVAPVNPQSNPPVNPQSNPDEEDDEESGKRDIHNNMERQRREDLRDSFDDLRQLIPEVYNKERAAKVVILREATKYCNFLTIWKKTVRIQRKELKASQKILKKRLKRLRKRAAKDRESKDTENKVQGSEKVAVAVEVEVKQN